MHTQLDDSSPFDDEVKTSLLPRHQPRKRKTSLVSRKNVGLSVAAGLLVIILALVAVLIDINLEVKWRLREFGRDDRFPIPDLPMEVIDFGHSDLYTAPRSKESDAAWEALAGPTSSKYPWSQQGFVLVDNWDAYDIGKGVPANGKRKYGISMFHQLHCLTAIRRIFYDMLDGTFDKDSFLAIDKNVGAPDFVPKGHGLWHAQHCFNYVRQGLQCAGDMSLEWPTFFNGTPIVVGWNNHHKCRSWDAAWKYAEDNA